MLPRFGACSMMSDRAESALDFVVAILIGLALAALGLAYFDVLVP